jgi:hypothetical protein
MRFEGILFPFLWVNRHGRIHQTLLIDAKENSAMKTMMLGKDACHHGQGLFAAVFLICCDENDMLALSWTFSPLVNQPLIAFRNRVLIGSAKTTPEKSIRKKI